MKTNFIFILVVLFFVGILPTINAESVPNWVKNNAGWWATDAISEKEFVNAIEFLITEGIIQINNSTEDKKSEKTLQKYNDFSNMEFWKLFDYNDTSIGRTLEGYSEVEYLNGYAYFVSFDSKIGRTGEVLRYDTTRDFQSVDAWSTFDQKSKRQYE